MRIHNASVSVKLKILEMTWQKQRIGYIGKCRHAVETRGCPHSTHNLWIHAASTSMGGITRIRGPMVQKHERNEKAHDTPTHRVDESDMVPNCAKRYSVEIHFAQV